MDDTFKFWDGYLKGLPEGLKPKAFADPPEHAPYPCRVYDGNGNLKYELTTEQLLDRNFRKYFRGFIKSESLGKRERGH